MLAGAQSYLVMRDNAAKGDVAARQFVLLKDLEMGSMSFAEASLRVAAAREGMPAPTVAKVEQALIDLHFEELRTAVRSSLSTGTAARAAGPNANRQAYLERWHQLHLDFFRADRIPSGKLRRSFLMSLMAAAVHQKQAEVLDKIGEMDLDATLRRYLDQNRDRLEQGR